MDTLSRTGSPKLLCVSGHRKVHERPGGKSVTNYAVKRRAERLGERLQLPCLVANGRLMTITNTIHPISYIINVAFCCQDLVQSLRVTASQRPGSC